MSTSVLHYNLRELRILLNTVFDDTDLDAFCLDYVAEVYDKISRGQNKTEKLNTLLDYCRRTQARFDRLLRGMYECNEPEFHAFLHDKEPKTDTTPLKINTVQANYTHTKDLPSDESHTKKFEFESAYGTMPPDSAFYVERQADGDCWGHLSQGQVITIFVQAPRQVGKSSLMRRMAYRAKKTLDIETVFIDFERFSEQQLEDEEDFLIELCFMIGDALGIPEAIDRYWGSRRRSNLVKCSNYLSRHIIRSYNKPFILAMDEVERLLDKPMRNNFFGMLRTWHNDRAWDPTYAKMSLFLSSSTEPHLFIDNPNQSPFNVAQPVLLHDFTFSEVIELNRRHQSPLNQDQVSALMDLLGGHPFLTRLAFYELRTHRYDFDTLLTNATSDTGPFAQHLHYYWQKILDMPELKPLLSQICEQRRNLEDKLYYRLKGAGLIKKAGSQVVMRNNLYKQYFMEQLNEYPTH